MKEELTYLPIPNNGTELYGVIGNITMLIY